MQSQSIGLQGEGQLLLGSIDIGPSRPLFELTTRAEYVSSQIMIEKTKMRGWRVNGFKI